MGGREGDNVHTACEAQSDSAANPRPAPSSAPACLHLRADERRRAAERLESRAEQQQGEERFLPPSPPADEAHDDAAASRKFKFDKGRKGPLGGEMRAAPMIAQ